LATIAGQLAGAIIVDLIVPVEGQHLGVERVVGAVIALVSVGVAAGAPRAHRVVTPAMVSAD
jgi:transporter family-2 protein